MSALVMVCKSDRVELLSDAALYDPIGGTVGAIHSKLAPLPELNCVMSGRGPIPVIWITAYVAGLCSTSFDDVVANFAAIRAEAATYNNGDVPADDWARADIAIVGWSQSRGRPEAYMSLGKGSPDTGLAPGSLNRCDVGIFAGASVDVVSAFAESVRESPDAFDAHTDGLAVMELLRREARPLSDEPGAGIGFSVGGYVELATVTPERVCVRAIHEWPDELGKPIVPAPAMAEA